MILAIVANYLDLVFNIKEDLSDGQILFIKYLILEINILLI